MVELLLMPSEGRCLKRVKRTPIVYRPGHSSWPGQPKSLSVKNPNAKQVAELRSPQGILAEIAALEAERAQVLVRIGGSLG
jgi:hypothetical protein